ncbi:MAG: secretin and TonB N-terminal domain-containing protein [Candidatus Omnitrophica bacterium]|nr:secretin and TonB N-terminal domain-containing protein [Candidatus Omnitrophota bacterium]
MAIRHLSQFYRRASVAALLLTLGIVSGTSLGLAQESPGTPPPSSHKQMSLITMDFRDTEIGDVLRLLAKQHDMNIILSEEVRGPITVQFSEVTVDEAIDAVITVNGYAYTRRGNVIKVTTPEAAEREPPVTRVFTVNNASVATLQAALQPVLTATGSIQVDERSRSIIVTDTAAAVESVGELINDLDYQTPQVLIESRIIETVLGDNQALGINWNMQASARGASRPTTAPWKNWGSDKDIYPQNEREISQEVVEVNGVDQFQTTIATDFGLKGVILGNDTLQFAQFPAAAITDFVFGTLDFSAFQAALQILYSNSETRTLSNPRVTTLDNQEARIVVGTRTPVPTFERNENTGSFEITGFDKEEVGITLTVTPHVSHDNYITMDIVPEVSSILRFTSEFEVPVVSTRTANTSVRVPDGHTVVIGGLLEEVNTEGSTKVPVLGDIPLLGYLFKQKTDDLTQTDLLVFITGHIMNDDMVDRSARHAISRVDKPSFFADPLVDPVETAEVAEVAAAVETPVKESAGKSKKPLKLNHRGAGGQE